MTARRKLTKAEAGKLGGLTTADRHGKEHMARIGYLGGQANLEKHGRAHMSRLNLKRHGRL